MSVDAIPRTPTDVLRTLLEAFGQGLHARAGAILSREVGYFVNGRPLLTMGPAGYQEFLAWLAARFRVSGVDAQTTLEHANVATADCLVSGRLLADDTDVVVRCAVSADVRDGQVNELLLRFDPGLPAVKTLLLSSTETRDALPWYRVTIPHGGRSEPSASAFLQAISLANRASGLPPGVEVYHGVSGAGDQDYVLSPAAARLIPELLETLRVDQIDPPASLANFTAVLL